MPDRHYDIIVIGSGPAGQQGAIEAARQGRRVAVVEKQEVIGGVCLLTGTMPSKSFREVVLEVAGWNQGALRERRRMPVRRAECMGWLSGHINEVIAKELRVLEGQFAKHGIALHYGQAEFVARGVIDVHGQSGVLRLRADQVLVASGTQAHRPADIPFDGQTILDSDEIFHIQKLPKRLLILGAGVIGLEYATMFQLLGVRVSVLNREPGLLPYVDRGLVAALESDLRRRRIAVFNGARVASFDPGPKGVRVVLASGKQVTCDMVLAAAGRSGTAAELRPERVGLSVSSRGLLQVDNAFRTSVPGIYAAGDVTGFPATASAAIVKGRMAARSMTGLDTPSDMFAHLPTVIYTIPEISWAGSTEQQLQETGTPYVAGVARFAEVSKGHIIGDETGLLKLLFSATDRRLLGVHIIGSRAAEIVHTGQAAMACSMTLEQLLGRVYNYPTLADAYRIASLDAELRLGGKRPPAPPLADPHRRLS